MITAYRRGFEWKAEGSIVNGSKITVSAARSPFFSGNYEVQIEPENKADNKIFVSGKIHHVTEKLFTWNMDAVNLLKEVANAISEPGALYEPPRNWREEHLTRHFTAKELAILACIKSGIQTKELFSDAFGMGLWPIRIGLIELKASGLVMADYQDGITIYKFTPSGEKLMKEASEEPPLRSCSKWLIAAGFAVEEKKEVAASTCFLNKTG